MSATLILSFIILLIGAGISIVAHEAGHMYAAKLYGMTVRQFSIGMPPILAAYKPKSSATTYTWGLLPCGGYCDIEGMTNLDTQAHPTRAMNNRPLLHRIAVYLAGIAVNLTLAAGILIISAPLTGIPNASANLSPVIDHIDTTTAPDEFHDLEPGSQILSINNEPISTIKDIPRVRKKDPECLDLEVKTPTGHTIKKTACSITPGDDIGLKLDTVDKPIIHTSSIKAIPYAAQYISTSAYNLTMSVVLLPITIPQTFSNESTTNAIISHSAFIDYIHTLNFLELGILLIVQFNIFIALLNILPMPPLDGGHILIACLEKLRNLYREKISHQPQTHIDYSTVKTITSILIALGLVLIGVITLAGFFNPHRFIIP